MKRRLDEEIVRRGLLESRTLAKSFILEGKVLVNGVVKSKPSDTVTESDLIEIVSKKEFVSRGGYKLDFAIKSFGLDVSQLIALDIGASTGGFTDCLLKHGVKKVYAVDVGKGLLDINLRNDPRVVVIEGFNARYLSRNEIKEEVDVVTIDVSFISVIKILNAVKELLKDDGDIVSLIKPQFEGSPKFLRKGVVKQKEFHKEILINVLEEIRKMDLQVINATYSPIRGGKGNIEFFFHIKKHGVFVNNEIIDKIVEEAWEYSR